MGDAAADGAAEGAEVAGAGVIGARTGELVATGAVFGLAESAGAAVAGCALVACGRGEWVACVHLAQPASTSSNEIFHAAE